MPTIVRDLDGSRWYSWAFTLFMAASALGTVLAGRLADRFGPAKPMLVALPVFGVGLLAAGSAGGIATLLIARAVQGLAAGGVIVPLYVMIARVYPEHHRPKAFGALSAAWILPSLIGPAVAGIVTEHLHWRWVFLGLVPLVALAAVFLGSTLLRLGGGAANPSGGRLLVLAAFGAACAVVALNWAGEHLRAPYLVLAAAAALLLWICLRVLLPSGTMTARPGIPAVVLSRGLLAGIFFGAQAFVPLTLTVVHGYSPAMAGAPLTLGSLGWSAGAFWQAGQRTRARESLIVRGFVLVAIAVAGLALVAPDWGWAWAAFPLWILGGSGMGIAIASTAVRVLSLSPEAERGYNSSALQISDMIGQAVLVGLGGVLVNALAAAEQPSRAVVVLSLALAVLSLTGASLLACAGRTTLERR